MNPLFCYKGPINLLNYHLYHFTLVQDEQINTKT